MIKLFRTATLQKRMMYKAITLSSMPMRLLSTGASCQTACRRTYNTRNFVHHPRSTTSLLLTSLLALNVANSSSARSYASAAMINDEELQHKSKAVKNTQETSVSTAAEEAMSSSNSIIMSTVDDSSIVCDCNTQTGERSFKLAEEFTDNDYVLLFFYPGDFTFVCPTEIRDMNANVDNFKQAKTKVFGVSVDSMEMHKKWRQTDLSEGGIGQDIKFDLLSDPDLKLSRYFRVLNRENKADRGTVIIDRNMSIIYYAINHDNVGRNIDEILRVVQGYDAAKNTPEHVCPAKWQAGQKLMTKTLEGVAQHFTKDL